MDKRKKVERNVKGLMELLEQMGGGEQVAKLKELPIVNEHDLRPVLEAEGILLTLQSAKRTIQVKACKECGEQFGTNYKYVAYCSNACRALALRKLSIKWDPLKKEEQRWGSESNPSQLPIIISKSALEQLRRIVDDIQAIQTQNEMVEFVEHQVQTQNENLPGVINSVVTEAYPGEIQDRLMGNLEKMQEVEYQRMLQVSHKVEEQADTNSDPELPASIENESQVQFSLDLFQ